MTLRLKTLMSALLASCCLAAAWSDPPTSESEAEALVASGMASMRDEAVGSKRFVVAAIDFAAALTYYDAHKDVDKICDLQADIFWCKKRMTLDDLNDYLAQKQNDHDVKTALARADAVTTAAVPVSEAQAYFDRAKAFADKHPDDLLEVSIHFYEVAERFQGTPTSLEAQRLSLDAQTRYAQSIADANAHQRDTLFTKPPVAGTKVSPPAEAALKDAMATVRGIYKDDYAHNTAHRRQVLIRKLLQQGIETADNPTLRYALLSEARDLAATQRDAAHALAATDELYADFSGLDLKTLRKAILSRISSSAAPAIIKLLDAPNDADANATAGKYFAFEAGEWGIALPMLAKGSDKILAKLAGMEMANPQTTPEKTQMADAWYEAGKKNAVANRIDLLTRAMFWYEKVEADTKGISKVAMDKRMQELSNLVPLPADFDFDHETLTLAQWEKIKAPVYVIEAANPRSVTDINLTADMHVRVVPNPTDHWQVSTPTHWLELDVTAKGDNTPRHWGALLVGVGRTPASHNLVVNGKGPLWFCADFPRGAARLGGAIRVKVINDDE